MPLAGKVTFPSLPRENTCPFLVKLLTVLLLIAKFAAATLALIVLIAVACVAALVQRLLISTACIAAFELDSKPSTSFLKLIIDVD